MFDGRDYVQAFDEACDELKFTKDYQEIRSKLIHIEWILDEAVRGVFFYQAMLLCLCLFAPLGFILDVGQFLWPAKILFLTLGLAFAVFVYWTAKFVFWAEISRHVKTRQFGDRNLKGDSKIT